MLDEEFEKLEEQDVGDLSTYILGQIGKHNILIACLPGEVYGTSSAANVVENMVRILPTLRFVLIIGLGGGAQSAQYDIRLGDVVISYT